MESGLREVVESRRLNAAAGWALVAVLVAVAVADAAAGRYVAAAFPLALAVLAVIPAAHLRTPRAMLPWEVLALAALPVVAELVVSGRTLFGITLTGRVSNYLAVAAVALIVAVEIDVFTPVRMTHGFAVLFTVVTTMAAAGTWAALRWLSDTYLGTALLLDGRAPEVIERTLMLDFVAATAVGVLAGVVFDRYFRRIVRVDDRLPPSVDAAGPAPIGADGEATDGGDRDADARGGRADR